MSQAATLSPSMNDPEQKTLFGHPLGLYVLFFTEMWERFSFYGMKTLLMLYMINHFFWSQEDASHLLGTYAALCYGLPVIGGFLADRYLGAKRAVVIGGVLLSIGHLLMAIETMFCFYMALGLIIAGVGLLKPNVSTQVGALYKLSDPRRDGAFTIFYMGINLGALIGPLLCDWLRVTYGWHYGFGAAGIGMILGLIVYVIGQRSLVEFSQDAGDEDAPGGAARAESNPRHVVRDRVIVLLIVFAFVILFWTAFEQSPNAMLVWADKHTNLQLAGGDPAAAVIQDLSHVATQTPDVSLWTSVKDWFSNPTMTSGQTQSFNPFFIITLAPLFAFFWVWLDKRKMQPSTPTKMVLGLALVAVAFGVMWPAAQFENRPSSVPLSALPEGVLVDERGQVYTLAKEEDDNLGEAEKSQPNTAVVEGTHEKVEAPAANRDFYGATRLMYNKDSATLAMSGVLTDLDRLRLLAATAPAALVDEFDAFIERTKHQPSREEHIAQLRLIFSLEGAVADADRLGEEAKRDPGQCYRDMILLVEAATKKATKEADKGWSISTVMEAVPSEIGAAVLTRQQGKEVKKVMEWDPETKILTAYEEIKDRPRIEFLAAAAHGEFKDAVDTIYIDSARFRVSVWWLIAFFMVLTMGELCLSPVGLSLVTKLAPAKFVGLCMGGWFLATALAEYSAQVFGAYWGKLVPGQYFLIFVVMCGVGALFMAVLIKPLKRMMHGVH